MLTGTTTVDVPVRSRLSWLLLSVPAALVAAALALLQLGTNPAGHIVGAVFNLAWVVFIVGACLIVRRRRTPVVTFDRYDIRLPYLRMFAPWTDISGGKVKHKGQELVLKVRKGGGFRLPAAGKEVSLSGSRPHTSTLMFPQVLVDRPVEELADLVAERGVLVERPEYRQRTTLLERTAIGQGLVLLFLSSQKGHHLYQTVYFWAGLAIIGLSFLGRRRYDWAMAAIVTVNVLVIGFVIVVPGPTILTRATAAFTLSLSLGGLLAMVDWPFTRVPSDIDDWDPTGQHR